LYGREEVTLRKEPLSGYLAVNLTPSDKEALERIAEEHGATLSGMIRKLIRDAAKLANHEQTEGRGSHEHTSTR